MPSTYTVNAGIELPANGEQSATWGTTVNDNMTIIDRLTNGVGAITLSGTSHTLTTTDGSVSDGHYKVLVLGGSPSGTNTVTISPNDAQHIYIVKNGSGQIATFTQGSGANISVANNTTKIIYSDGAGSGAAVVDITGSLDLGSLVIDGVAVTSTASELNLVDGSSAGTIVNSKAVVYSSGGQVNGTTLAIAGTAISADAAEINVLDGVTAGTVIASKALVADANIDITGGRNITISGELDAATLDLSGAADLGSSLTLSAGASNWVAAVLNNDLVFSYGGSNKMKLDTSGNLTVTGNVIAYGTIS